MRVPQRLDYALRALILLALQPDNEVIAAGDLADYLGLPRRFVEQQVTVLARAGIVSCRRGATGGCSLGRPANEITVLDVVEAVQGQVLDVPHVTGSAASALWEEADEALSGFLGGTTLSVLAAKQREMDRAIASMYWI
ncbi:MAG: Rrf2 family transcriptional regulator [Coriobacteriia bacterium]|nr:Rrf2 family transcriptional regulator [Coriobacteriia bacterium]